MTTTPVFPIVPTDPLYIYKWVAKDTVDLNKVDGMRGWKVVPAKDVPGMNLNAVVNGRIEAFGCVLLRRMDNKPAPRMELATQMTLRDWFAGQALSGAATGDAPGRLADWAYELADHMMERRKT